jgi:hypothetical protein
MLPKINLKNKQTRNRGRDALPRVTEIAKRRLKNNCLKLLPTRRGWRTEQSASKLILRSSLTHQASKGTGMKSMSENST